MKRCSWANELNPLYLKYHDEEWGVPSRDDQHLFEMLILEGAQAGLSWETILNKREAYRAAFDGFDAQKISRYSDAKVAKLMQNPGIVRNQLKIRSTIVNARAFLDVQKECGSFAAYLWSFVGDEQLRHKRAVPKDVPATTKESDALSKDLKKRGFKFVGSTICYAYMQAVGLVDDHIVSCFRHGAYKPQR